MALLALLVIAASVLVVGVTLLLRVEHSLRGAPKVPQVEVLNRSDLLVDVDVSGASREGWLEVATARPGTVTTTRDVVDQGDTWYFRFRWAGIDGGELRMSRAELEDAGWRISVPDRVVAALEGDQAGVSGS